MKVSEHFILQELISPEIYNHPAIGNRAIDFINPMLIKTLEDMRGDFGSITVNNWNIDGSYEQSGLRAPDSDTGAAYSAHRFGTAFDLKFKDTNPEDVYFEILNNQASYPYITRIEDATETRTWLHIECGSNMRDGEIIVFRP